jgi:hypothetical protein
VFLLGCYIQGPPDPSRGCIQSGCVFRFIIKIKMLPEGSCWLVEGVDDSAMQPCELRSADGCWPCV